MHGLLGVILLCTFRDVVWSFFFSPGHVTFYKTLTSLSTVFIKGHVGLLQLLKWPCHTSFFAHVEPLQWTCSTYNLESQIQYWFYSTERHFWAKGHFERALGDPKWPSHYKDKCTPYMFAGTPLPPPKFQIELHFALNQPIWYSYISFHFLIGHNVNVHPFFKWNFQEAKFVFILAGNTYKKFGRKRVIMVETAVFRKSHYNFRKNLKSAKLPENAIEHYN